MVRAIKSVEKQTASKLVATVVEVKPKKEKKQKVAEVVAPVSAETEQVVQPVVVVDEPHQLIGKMAGFNTKLQSLFASLSGIRTEFKVIEKEITREIKQIAKAQNKKRKSNANRKPSGFVKPTRISDELAEFLGKEIGTELARTTVSKEINTYINAHNLQDSKNGRIIHADPKLTKLLKVQPNDELTYFNLQKYMKHHFVKETPTVSV
jgi:chromatin remodeling complex protein RSC6